MIRIASLAALLALMVSGPALAQEETATGSRLEPSRRAVTNADHGRVRQTLYRFVDCAVSRRRTQVRKVIDARTKNEQELASTAFYDVQRCNLDAYVAETSSMVSMTADTGSMRGMVAEVFLKRDDKLDGHEPRPRRRIYERDWFPITSRARQIDEMAVCVADTNPAGIATVLRSEIATKAERAAIMALAPSFGPCLATGYKLEADMAALRASLAEALYHRAFDPEPAPEVESAP